MATSTIQGGPLPINRGGTGKTTAADARTALGIKVYSRSQFVVTSHKVQDKGTVAANGYITDAVAISKEGYYPIGIIGANSSGTGNTFVAQVKSYLSNRASGSCTLNYTVRNVSASKIDATYTLTYYILWTPV